MFFNNRFFLMNKDQRVLSFLSQQDENGKILLKEEQKDGGIHTPIGYRDINEWLEKRRAPKHRRHIEELLKICGCDNIDGYMRVTHALSLNDTFWIKQEDDNLKWNDVSLYRNRFNGTIARIAFEGGLYGEQFSTTSPEFSTDGSYAKCWVRKRDDIYLIKQGTDFMQGREVFSEKYASEVAACICKKSVPYQVEKYRGRLVCSCPLFTSEDVGYAPAWKFIDPESPTDILKFMAKYGADDDFRRMLVLDALIVNTDRHAGNYGMLIDNDNMQVLGMAPVFDHNLSLFPGVADEWLLSDKIREDVFPKIGNDFNLTANDMLTREIRSDLKNLRDFQFSRGGKYQLNEQRLKKLEQMIQTQSDKILGRISFAIPQTINKYQQINQSKNIDEVSYISLNAEIGVNATIVDSEIEDEAKVLDNATVKYSTIQGKAIIKENASVSDSFVDENAIIGGQVIVSQYSHIGGNTNIAGDAIFGKEACVFCNEDIYTCGRTYNESSPESSQFLPSRLTFYRKENNLIGCSFLDDTSKQIISYDGTKLFDHILFDTEEKAFLSAIEKAEEKIYGGKLSDERKEQLLNDLTMIRNSHKSKLLAISTMDQGINSSTQSQVPNNLGMRHYKESEHDISMDDDISTDDSGAI